METKPKVYADCRLERTGKIWSWVIPACPFCGKKHTHGGGPLDGNPRTRMGNRGAHCLDSRGKDYFLREIVDSAAAPIDYAKKPDIVDLQARLHEIEDAEIGPAERSELFSIGMEILTRLEEIEERLAKGGL